MQLMSGIAAKTILQTEVGEWFRFTTHYGDALAWVIGAPNPDRQRTLYLIHLDGVRPPETAVWTRDDLCISFGTACVIEPVGLLEPTADRTKFHSTPGTLLLTARGSYLKAIDAMSDFKDVMDYDIATGAVREHHGGDQLFFRRWNLWMSETERLRVDAEPLLEYSIDDPQDTQR